MMTPDATSVLSLLVKLNDTIDAQQQRIDQLEAEIARRDAESQART